MWKPPKPAIYGAGLFIAGHYILADYGKQHTSDDQLQPPPLAAVALNQVSTGSISAVQSEIYRVNAITDEQHTIDSPQRPISVARST